MSSTSRQQPSGLDANGSATGRIPEQIGNAGRLRSHGPRPTQVEEEEPFSLLPDVDEAAILELDIRVTDVEEVESLHTPRSRRNDWKKSQVYGHWVKERVMLRSIFLLRARIGRLASASSRSRPLKSASSSGCAHCAVTFSFSFKGAQLEDRANLAHSVHI